MPTRHAFRFILPLIALTLTFFAASVAAQTFTLLHTFTGPPDGWEPYAVLLRDSMGNLYGTTDGGGTQEGVGTIFRLDPTGKETILHYFNGPFGCCPEGAGLTIDPQGNAYGTGYAGGAAGDGVVYKLEKSLRYTVLRNFTGSDGQYPVGGLVRDPQGNLYGTTSENGALGGGTIFKVDAIGNFSVLHNFDATTDGNLPRASMIRGPGGYLYGTAYWGGAGGAGTVFRFDPKSGRYTVLHTFNPHTDGGNPYGRLVADSQGNLYGTTSCELGCGSGFQGTIFKLTPSRQFTVLHTFTLDGVEGQAPESGLIFDSQGNLYGTTSEGGVICGTGFLCGTVFKMDQSGDITVLHTFSGLDDGGYPRAELIMDSAGNLYGTTWLGSPTYGRVFMISPQ